VKRQVAVPLSGTGPITLILFVDHYHFPSSALSSQCIIFITGSQSSTFGHGSQPRLHTVAFLHFPCTNSEDIPLRENKSAVAESAGILMVLTASISNRELYRQRLQRYRISPKRATTASKNEMLTRFQSRMCCNEFKAQDTM
jgi:hypothetical protein